MEIKTEVKAFERLFKTGQEDLITEALVQLCMSYVNIDWHWHRQLPLLTSPLTPSSSSSSQTFTAHSLVIFFSDSTGFSTHASKILLSTSLPVQTDFEVKFWWRWSFSKLTRRWSCQLYAMVLPSIWRWSSLVNRSDGLAKKIGQKCEFSKFLVGLIF